eukprot:2574845-Prymnesium_polylepis.2
MRGADATTLALMANEINAHSGAVLSVGFSPDGTRIVSGSGAGGNYPYSMKVWGERRFLAVLSCARGRGERVLGSG